MYKMLLGYNMDLWHKFAKVAGISGPHPEFIKKIDIALLEYSAVFTYDDDVGTYIQFNSEEDFLVFKLRFG